ncbi:MAG: type I restriction enzyme HsdR N-terminal domain-containing protein [Alistipes sp.]
MLTPPNLNFSTVQPRLKRRGKDILVWDNLRGLWLVLTPEEWVRQNLIGHLIAQCGALPMRIVEEYAVNLNGQPQRADVVIFDAEARPLLLAECKATTIAINQQTLAQAVRYNSVLQARFILLTNGLSHYCYEFSAQGYQPMDHLPDLSLL